MTPDKTNTQPEAEKLVVSIAPYNPKTVRFEYGKHLSTVTLPTADLAAQVVAALSPAHSPQPLAMKSALGQLFASVTHENDNGTGWELDGEKAVLVAWEDLERVMDLAKKQEAEQRPAPSPQGNPVADAMEVFASSPQVTARGNKIPDMFDAAYQYGWGDAREEESSDPVRVEAAWKAYLAQLYQPIEKLEQLPEGVTAPPPAEGLDAVAEYLREMAKRETPSKESWSAIGNVSRVHWRIRAQEVIDIASRPALPLTDTPVDGAHWNFCVRTMDASRACNCLPPYARPVALKDKAPGPDWVERLKLALVACSDEIERRGVMEGSRAEKVLQMAAVALAGSPSQFVSPAPDPKGADTDPRRCKKCGWGKINACDATVIYVCPNCLMERARAEGASPPLTDNPLDPIGYRADLVLERDRLRARVAELEGSATAPAPGDAE